MIKSILLATAVFIASATTAHAQCVGQGGINTIHTCADAVSPQQADEVLVYQQSQTPHTRKMPLSTLLGMTPMPNASQIATSLGYTPINPANASAAAVTATGGATARTMADRAAEKINLKDFGAKGDAVGWTGGVMSIGSNALNVPTATFTAADVGKAISVTGAGTGVVTKSGTITGFTDSTHVTVSFTADIATPHVGALYATVGTLQSGAGSYAPGDTITTSAGSPAAAAVFKVLDTELASATVNAAGSGGTNGACILTGTTGTQRANGLSNLFTINATISGGAISALGSIISAGDYTANPTSLAAEPVTSNCNLTGATLTLKMGVSDVTNLFYTNPGIYSALPSGAQATTTSGSGTGATITLGSPSVRGGQVTYGTDDSAALADAINYSNAQYSAGKRAVIDVPAGNYYLKSTLIPTFIGSGSLIGSAAFKSTFYVDPAFVGDVFSWSNAWLGIVGSFPTPGFTSSLAKIGYGPTIERISIVGDLSAPTQQNAFMFYDRNDFIVMSDVNVMYLNGRSLCLGCALKNGTVAYTRESRFSRLRFNQVGQAGVPVMEIASIATGNADDLRFSQIDIYGHQGPGLVIRAGVGSQVGENHFSQLRVEGSEYQWPQPVGDHIQIGDPAWLGTVSNLFFDQVQLVSPYSGSSALHFAGAGVNSTYYIYFSASNITGGFPLGKGIKVDAGRLLFLDLADVYTFDTNVTVASNATVSTPIALSMYGTERLLTYSVDTTSTNFLVTPIFKQGLPGGNTLGGGCLDLQTSRTAATQTCSGSTSTILGGINQTLSSTATGGAITNGATNILGGTYARVGGLRANDRNRYGADCYASGFFLNTQGESQTCTTVLRGETTSTTPIRLTSNGVSTATSATCINIPDNYTFATSILLVARNKTTTGNNLVWTIPTGILYRDSGIGTTTWSAPAATTQSTGAIGTVTAAADTSLGCLSLTWTAPNSDIWDVTARVVTVENGRI